MKTTLLLKLGGLALVLSAVLAAIGQTMYFVSGQPSVLGYWIGFAINVLQVLGFGALFARQAQRGGLLGLVGYVLLVLSLMFFVGNLTVGLEMTAGVISNEQIAQVPGFAPADSISTWTWIAGLIVFGISIYQAHVFPKSAGALVIVMGLLSALIPVIDLAQYPYALSVVVVWAWLGWALLREEGQVSHQPAVPARDNPFEARNARS